MAEYREYLADTVSFKLLRIGYLILGSSWNFKNVCSDFWRIYVPLKDGSWIDLPDRRHELTPDHVHIIPSGVLFNSGCRPPVPQLYFHLDPVGLPTGVLLEPIALPFKDEFKVMADKVIGLFQTGETMEIMLRLRSKAFIFLVLNDLMEHLSAHEPDAIASLVARHDPIAAAIQYIESHLRDAMTNTQLSELCHFSVDHFVRKFKEATGQTPAQYIQSRRIAAAGHRLLTSTDSIEQIAEYFGFLDRFHFSRIFSRKTGIGPAAYRKRNHH